MPDGLPGLDISHYQKTVDWPAVAAKGAMFAYMKATEWISPVASDAGGPPGMPAGWSAYTFYQRAKSGTFPGDQDVFAGTAAELAAFAAGPAA